jgi:MFS transporter, FLVCR family, feline leukemia virus subgroup C receptor-related protein
MSLDSTNIYKINITHCKTEINYLKPYNNLPRKKSLSLSVLPIQNNQFLCVPPIRLQRESDKEELCKSITTDDLRLKREKSFEELRRLASQSSLTIPDDFSFQSLEIQVYKIRWMLLALIAADTAVSYMQWIQYSIIANIIMKYYNIDSVRVDWTSMIFMITYIIFVIPISYIMDCRVSLAVPN